MSGVIVGVDAKTSKAERDLQKVATSLDNIEKSASRASKTLSRAFVGLGSAIAASVSIGQIGKITSDFVQLGNQIAVVTGRTKELGSVQRSLFKVSERTRGSIENTVKTFGSFGRALRGQGKSTEDLLMVTELVQKSIALSATTSAAASGSIMQLGQGLAAGALRGEELNSVLEGMPRLAFAIADGLGISQGSLKKLGEAGSLLSDQVFEAILSQASQINKEFKDIIPTVMQAKAQLGDGLKIYISELDKGLGLSEGMSKKLLGWSKAIRKAAESAFYLGTRFAYHIAKIKGEIGQLAKPFAKLAICSLIER